MQYYRLRCFSTCLNLRNAAPGKKMQTKIIRKFYFQKQVGSQISSVFFWERCVYVYKNWWLLLDIAWKTHSICLCLFRYINVKLHATLPRFLSNLMFFEKPYCRSLEVQNLTDCKESYGMISLILEFLAPWQDLGLRINFWIIWIMKVCIQVHEHLVAHISQERPNPTESDCFLVCIYAQREHLHRSMNPGHCCESRISKHQYVVVYSYCKFWARYWMFIAGHKF